jgi:hypothetical protein
MLEEAGRARSPHIYLALTLALSAGIRDKEIKSLSWAQINIAKATSTIGTPRPSQYTVNPPGAEGLLLPRIEVVCRRVTHGSSVHL